MHERSIDIALRSNDLDIAALLAGLPADMQPQSVRAAGRSRLSLTVVGPVGEGVKPQVDGTLQLEEVSASHGVYGELLTDASGEVRFDLGSLSLPALRGNLLGRPFELQLAVSDFETRHVDGRVSGEADLARLAELRDAAAPMAGTLRFDLGFTGPATRPAELRISGPVQLEGVSYQSSSLAVPARIASATIRLTGSGVVAQPIPVRLGASDLNIAFSSPNALLYALSGDHTEIIPRVEFSVTSRRLDLSEITAADTTRPGYSDLLTARLAGKQLEGRDPVELARERYTPPPIPPLEASGRVRITEFLNPPTRAENLSFDVAVRNGVLELRDVAGRLYGGALSGALALDLSGGQPPFALRYDLRLSGGQAGEFLQRWTRLGRALSGLIDFNISGTTAIDEVMLPTPDAINAAGRASFEQGRFLDFGLTNALARQFRLDTDKLSGFRQLGGAFRIEKGAFLVQDWGFDGRDLKGAVGGSAGLGGNLDLRVNLELPLETLQRAGLIESGGGVLGDLLGQLAGADQVIQVAVGIGGTMTSPTLGIDREALQEELAKRLEGQGRDLLRRLIKPPE